MKEEIHKPPTDYELRDEIRKCNGNPDKLVHLFHTYVGIYLLYITDEASKVLGSKKDDPNQSIEGKTKRKRKQSVYVNTALNMSLFTSLARKAQLIKH